MNFFYEKCVNNFKKIVKQVNKKIKVVNYFSKYLKEKL